MGGSWKLHGFQLHLVSCFLVLMVLLQAQECQSLNLEGLALLEFRASVDNDPYGVLANWNPNDDDPCIWSGIHCVDGKVKILELKGLSLGGVLAPELGKLTHLQSLILHGNNFSGSIPKEIGALTMLEQLDLRDNNLSGTIPAELFQLSSLKQLLLCHNNFKGGIPEMLLKHNCTFSMATAMDRLSRKFGHCIWQSSISQLKKADIFGIVIKEKLLAYLDLLLLLRRNFLHGKEERCCDDLPSSVGSNIMQNVQAVVNFSRRRLLEEFSNLPAAPASGSSLPIPMATVPSIQSSGAFPAIPNGTKRPPLLAAPAAPAPAPAKNLGNGKQQKYVFVVPGLAAFLTISAVMLCICRYRGSTTAIAPWRTGMSGQLQKALLTGVPKLNRQELEIACEDFSNIIGIYEHCTVFKGTLSSGVEIAVQSTTIASVKYWSERAEMVYRKKIDTLSRLNHKNFVNLLGYCEDDDPFLRTMVFEYAPSGTLFEHLHLNEFDHLDWNARMRIIMGIAYCLQYMHHELNPPIVHSNLQSKAVFLTDDYAAKLAEIDFWVDFTDKSKISFEDESGNHELVPLVDPETNVYHFGILLLEIISGKLPYSEETGSIIDMAFKYLNYKESIGKLVDPNIKSFKRNELKVICEAIQDCIHEDPRQRLTMKEITNKLRGVIGISPDAATQRLSPLWWAELEILSVEVT